MILGNYYITMEKAGVEGEGRAFKNTNEALRLYKEERLLFKQELLFLSIHLNIRYS